MSFFGTAGNSTQKLANSGRLFYQTAMPDNLLLAVSFRLAGGCHKRRDMLGSTA